MGKAKQTHSTPLTEKMREFYHWTICNDSSRLNRLNVVLGYRDYDDRGLNTWLLQLLVSKKQKVNFSLFHCWGFKQRQLYSMTSSSSVTEDARPLVFSVMFLLNFLTRETTTTTTLSEAAAEPRRRLHADEADWLTERRWPAAAAGSSQSSYWLRRKPVSHDHHMTITWPQPTLTQCQCL